MAQTNKQTIAVAVAGSSIAHGVTGTPDEIVVLATVAQGAGGVYRYATSDATNVYLASGTSATTADVTCRVNNSLIK